MAEIVAAFGVPHTPNFPALVAKQGPDCRTAQLYAQVAALLHDASPDVLVIYTDDHFNTFFLNNFPTFAIGVDALMSAMERDAARVGTVNLQKG